jgi:hypothetical protein
MCARRCMGPTSCSRSANSLKGSWTSAQGMQCNEACLATRTYNKGQLIEGVVKQCPRHHHERARTHARTNSICARAQHKAWRAHSHAHSHSHRTAPHRTHAHAHVHARTHKHRTRTRTHRTRTHSHSHRTARTHTRTRTRTARSHRTRKRILRQVRYGARRPQSDGRGAARAPRAVHG